MDNPQFRGTSGFVVKVVPLLPSGKQGRAKQTEERLNGLWVLIVVVIRNWLWKFVSISQQYSFRQMLGYQLGIKD